MELESSSNGGRLHTCAGEPRSPGDGEFFYHATNPILDAYVDSSCATPFASAPSSPGRTSASGAVALGLPVTGVPGYYFSCPASPMHYVLSSSPFSTATATSPAVPESDDESTFEFYGASAAGSMISADEIFLNGQIRPMKFSSHLQRPQSLAPLLDLDDGDEEEEETDGRDGRIRGRYTHRRTKSMSPLRRPRFQWQDDMKTDRETRAHKDEETSAHQDQKLAEEEVETEAEAEEAAAPSESSSSSRSSSSGRNSKRWIFLKDLLYRSKSEGSGRANGKDKERFWHSISFSPSLKSRPPLPPSASSPTPGTGTSSEEQKTNVRSSASSSAPMPQPSAKPANGLGRRHRRSAVPAPPPPSAHERHYAANRAQAEEMRRRTFLPYRQGLLGCLGFRSRSYGAFYGFAKSLNPVTSR